MLGTSEPGPMSAGFRSIRSPGRSSTPCSRSGLQLLADFVIGEVQSWLVRLVALAGDQLTLGSLLSMSHCTVR
jgi:hypothetical protein